jgi:hypothetical protein
MPLAQVADRSRIPIGLLRQLEWGYLANWPTGHYGRTQLIRYARATGLDEQVVVGTIVPLIEDADARRLALQEPALAAPELEAGTPPAASPQPQSDAAVGDVPLYPAAEIATDIRQDGARRRRRAMAALAIPALLALGLTPFWLSGSGFPWPAPVEAPSLVQNTDPEPAVAEPTPSPAPSASAPAPPAGQSASPTETAAPEVPAAPSEGPDGVVFDAAMDYEGSGFNAIGTAMFYSGDEEDDGAALVRADAGNGGSVLRITRIVDDSARNFHVRPSPDGQRIAFDSDRGGGHGVYVADSDGQNVRRVSPDGFAAIPSWAPDGTRLAFVRANADTPSVWDVWTLDLENGALEQVTNQGAGQPFGASWFPDGRRLAYSHDSRLVIHDLQTGATRAFPSPRRGRAVRIPTVSPDGDRIMFQVEGDGAWLLEMDNGSMRRVLEDPTAEEFTWAPDGRRMAYHSRRTNTWAVWIRIAN